MSGFIATCRDLLAIDAIFIDKNSADSFDSRSKTVYYLYAFFTMVAKKNNRFQAKGGPAFQTRSTCFYLITSLVWFSIIAAIVSAKPSPAHAAKLKPIRKEAVKSKPPAPAPPVRTFTKAQAQKALLRTPTPAPIDPGETREHVVQRTRSGESLLQLFSRFNLLPSEKQFWLRAIKRNGGAQILPAGKEVHLFFFRPATADRKQAPAQLKALELDYNDSATLAWEKSTKGILFQKREKPFDVELKTVSGSIENSLFDDGTKAGVPAKLLSQLADIFTWDVDLEKEIRKGDSYKILYEERSRKGQEAKASLRILAAELINAGQKLTAIYFEKQRGQGNYYNLEGRSLARSFLRFPLEFTSITSHLAHARFHPILKVSLPHNGVDFAAQRGTPVRAVGDGVISQIGWNGNYGKAIDVQHDNTYMSRYAHLDRFADGIQNGTLVTKGQIIGYVGSTGRSTGPHLHFELHKDQQVIDPLSVDFPADETIEPALQRVFDNQKQTYLVALSALPQS
jgi:murein DD-endopeptidase MepM/ murein hydrolase activator NlpD